MNARYLGALLAAALPLLTAGAADEPKDKAKKPVETFTDPAKAGPDYLIQGEYTGESPNLGKPAVQVIAEGDGKFAMRALKGGLPGEGWDAKTQIKFTAETKDGTVSFTGDRGQGTIGGGKLTAMTPSGETINFQRVERHSPTEGTKPPAGAIVLFDGTSADAWENGKIVEGNLLKQGTTSKQKFTDYTLHVEFRLPFMPRARGQARGNSGVYNQGRYEVQVLDSFGLDGKDNECGGIYEQSAPLVNMCYPPLQWQTYDIDYTAPRFDADAKKTKGAVITVKHNGVLVQDHFEIKGATRAAPVKEGPEPGPIYLQDHGNPVVYRNIWLVEKK
jgi:Domain of Unknown Function (DUF1080)